MITSIGWQAVTAKDGLEAIEILESFIDDLPDVILTDIEMPRMDGYEFISALKNHVLFKHIPILVITSRTSDKHKQKAFQLGVSSYITKPFDQRTLIEKVNEVLK
jgi:CheY-like chemotaxis protein